MTSAIRRASTVFMSAQMRKETLLLTLAAMLIIATISLAAPHLDVTLNEFGTEVLGVGLPNPTYLPIARVF